MRKFAESGKKKTREPCFGLVSGASVYAQEACLRQVALGGLVQLDARRAPSVGACGATGYAGQHRQFALATSPKFRLQTARSGLYSKKSK